MVVGIEDDANGNALRSVTLERSYWNSDWLPVLQNDPKLRSYRNKYVLRDGMVVTELKAMSTDDRLIGGRGADQFRPVAGTSCWVIVGYYDPGSQIDIICVDKTGVLYDQKQLIYHDPKGKVPAWTFEAGNTLLDFRDTYKVPHRFDIVNGKLF